MPFALSLHDETTAGERRSAGTFQFDSTNLTLREIIRLRVQQEVARFNEAEYEVFRGLVQPEESERILNGVRTRPILDWQKQSQKPSLRSTVTASSFSWTIARSWIWTKRSISPRRARSHS
jgi:hypothetical protein